MKKVIGVLLTFVIAITTINVSASASDYVYANDALYKQFQNIQKIEKCYPKPVIGDETTVKEIIRFQKIWSELIATGQLCVDEEAHIAVRDMSIISKDGDNCFFVDALGAINESIDIGFLIVDPIDMSISTRVDESIEKIINIYNNKKEIIVKYNKTGLGVNDGCLTNNLLKSQSSHGCGLKQLDILFIGSKNYNELQNYYSFMQALMMSAPLSSIDPYMNTILYWISKVQEGGDWDYKSRDGYSPWYREFCTYYDGAIKHITSEYLGNFNFGYTGKFLFSLSVLHAGSFAVAGFDTSDYDDWPAIDDGYYHAP